jgi:hypothetical protein
MLDDREDDGMIIFETEEANKSLYSSRRRKTFIEILKMQEIKQPMSMTLCRL